MTDIEESKLSTIRAYLATLEAGEVGESLRRFFAEDARQFELPNRLNPAGQESDLAVC